MQRVKAKNTRGLPGLFGHRSLDTPSRKILHFESQTRLKTEADRDAATLTERPAGTLNARIQIGGAHGPNSLAHLRSQRQCPGRGVNLA